MTEVAIIIHSQSRVTAARATASTCLATGLLNDLPVVLKARAGRTLC